MTTIELDPTTRIFCLAQAAHGEVSSAKTLLTKYTKTSRKQLSVGDLTVMVESLNKAKEELEQAVKNWGTIVELIKDNPELQS